MNDLRTQQPGASAAAPENASGRQNRYGDSALMPPVDVIEDASGITLYADLPGVAREALHLQVESGTLTIDAELELGLPQGLQSSHTEVGLARFHRTFTLSPELDTEKVKAELTQGVLRLSIPKAEHAKPRRISVNAA
jgi:HSP20 family protein